MKRLIRMVLTLVLVGVLAILLVRRAALSSTDSPAANLLPDLEAYRQVEGETLTTYIGALAEGAALLGAQPQLAAAVATIDQVVGCYQAAGAIQARLYSHRQNLLAAGAVAVADMSRVQDPETLLACVGPELLSQESVLEPQGPACLTAYSFTNDDGRFNILLAGSTELVCSDLCGQLAGCQLANLTGPPLE